MNNAPVRTHITVQNEEGELLAFYKSLHEQQDIFIPVK